MQQPNGPFGYLQGPITSDFLPRAGRGPFRRPPIDVLRQGDPQPRSVTCTGYHFCQLGCMMPPGEWQKWRRPWRGLGKGPGIPGKGDWRR